MTTCTYCDGKKTYSVYAGQSVAGDFIGDRVTAPTKHIANLPCRHCKGTGECAEPQCKCNRSVV